MSFLRSWLFSDSSFWGFAIEASGRGDLGTPGFILLEPWPKGAVTDRVSRAAGRMRVIAPGGS
jgi:hypothetical protein